MASLFTVIIADCLILIMVMRCHELPTLCLTTPLPATTQSQVTSVVGPNRERLDACLCFPSMPAVMKLNKLGTFSMAQLGQSRSIIGDFIKSARKVYAQV